nr:PREDICTED: uncharacterized protein LOC108218532 [Daucus carota subsp. sativus]
MGIAMDDFSFPQVADDQIVNLTITPSLWRISSLVFPEYNRCREEDDDVNSMNNLQRKSSGSGAEEKMDTLWEDMNDYDYRSERSEINRGDGQSLKIRHRVSLKKSKINAVVIKQGERLLYNMEKRASLL